MRIVQLLLALVWLVIVAITVIAIQREGLSASVDVFSYDLAALGWRAQFDADLLAHLSLLGLWAAWRHRFSLAGIAAGLCCAFGGSLFSFAYIFVLLLHSGGDPVKVLLGQRYPAAGSPEQAS